MKLSLALLMIIFLSLAAIACSGSPDTQEHNQTSLDNDSALSKVALEVPTIT